MLLDLPELYFRIKDNGASVYRVSKSSKSGRIEFSQIATAVLRNDKIKPHSDHELTDNEIEQITNWMASQKDNHLSDLAQVFRRISRDVNLATNLLSSDNGAHKELNESINLLLLSLLDMQRATSQRAIKVRAGS